MTFRVGRAPAIAAGIVLEAARRQATPSDSSALNE